MALEIPYDDRTAGIDPISRNLTQPDTTPHFAVSLCTLPAILHLPEEY
jgi:hypothetical protein